MEYVSRISIFGLKMMMKSGLEKIFLEIPPCAKPFSDLLIYFIKVRIFALNYKFSNKNDLVCAWRDFNFTSCVLSTYPKGPVGTEKSSIFNFKYVNKVWISGVLGVKDQKNNIDDEIYGRPPTWLGKI